MYNSLFPMINFNTLLLFHTEIVYVFVFFFLCEKYLAHYSNVWLGFTACPTAHVTGIFQTIRTACAVMCFCYPTARAKYVAVPKSMQHICTYTHISHRMVAMASKERARISLEPSLNSRQPYCWGCLSERESERKREYACEGDEINLHRFNCFPGASVLPDNGKCALMSWCLNKDYSMASSEFFGSRIWSF